MALFPDITCDDIFRLETAHLWLRWLRATDAPALTALAGLAAVAQMTATLPHPYPPGEAERFILHSRAETAAGDSLILAVAAKTKTQPLVGLVSAVAGERHEVEIGYMIAPAMAGRGYASEATATLVETVFNLTEARNVIANSRIVNPASRRVLEKCGFVFLRSAPHLLPARGGAHPCDFFEIDRHRWSARGRASRLPAMAQQRAPAAPRQMGEHSQ